MSTPRRRPIYPDVHYPDADALELIDRLLASWVFVQDEHLTKKQREKKWDAREKAEEAAAIAIARDGNFQPLVDMREHRNLSKEAEQLIGEKAKGLAKRSHRSGPAHFEYSPNYRVAMWVPVIKEILRVFCSDLFSERERAGWAVALTAKYYNLNVESFIVFWDKKYKKGRPSSVANDLVCFPGNDLSWCIRPPPSTTAELNRFRKHLVLERKLYLKYKKESRKIFPRLFAE